MITESAKAWVAAILTMVIAIATYAVAQDWATWSLEQWRGMANAALEALPQTLVMAGAVWAIPNRKPAK